MAKKRWTWKRIKRRAGVRYRWTKRKTKKYARFGWRLGKRYGRRARKKAARRLRRLPGLLLRLARHGPRRLTRRWVKKKARRAFGKRTTRIMVKGQLKKSIGQNYGARRGSARHDIVPGRTVVEWRPRPETGRGLVLAWLPGGRLDVQFELGGRPPSGIPVEEIRVLA